MANTALNTRFLSALGDHLEFDKGEMDALVSTLCGLVEEQTAPLIDRIAELEANSGTQTGKVKVKTARKGSGKSGKSSGPKKANDYSRFVKLASAISKGEDAEGKDISFTPTALTADKAIARWSQAPSDLIDFDTEYRLEDLIGLVKGHDSFSNLMVCSSLVWGMIPSEAKDQVIAVLA